MAYTLRILIALAALLAFAGSASAQIHRDLGDDPITERDVPGELAAPDAAVASVPSQAGCITDFLDTNFSSRNGADVREPTVHYTVSSNVEGWADVNAIVNFFNRASTDASSNYVIDFEGHCKYIVNESAKAWTQGFFNPWAVSIEFIATGRETTNDWLTKGMPGLRKGAQVFAAVARRYGIPREWVNPSACNVPVGFTDHERLECGNNHTDVQPNFPYTTFLNLVKARFAPPAPVKVEFLLADGEGKILAKSTPVACCGAAEADRYRLFLLNHRVMSLSELKQDRDVRIVRRKVG